MPPRPLRPRATEMELDANEQLRYLDAMRREEAEYLRQARKAFPVPAGMPLLGSFQEDDPEIHRSFASEAPEPEQSEPADEGSNEPAKQVSQREPSEQGRKTST